MMKKFVLALAFALLLLTLAVPVFAAPPDNPGNAPDALERTVFVHYGKNFAKPAAKPAPPGAKLYSYSGYHWDTSKIPVQYWINPTGSPVPTADIGIQASFQTWQDDLNSSVTFAYAGNTDATAGINASAPDYQNVVGWVDLSASYPNAIGVTVVWSLRGTKHIVDADTALNTVGFAWVQAEGTTDPNSALLPDTAGYDTDVQNIMTHEAGHWLMLNDLYSTAASQQTMYGYALDRELKKRSLESGDLAGVKKIYP